MLRHKIYEHVEIKGGTTKLKQKLLEDAICMGHHYVPGLFGMTLSYCKDVNDWDVSSAVAEPSTAYLLESESCWLIQCCWVK